MEQTLILPGFSIHNRVWAQDLKKFLSLGNSCEIINYHHWETGNPEDFHFEAEAEKISHKLINKKYNIIAKSIGTLIAMSVIRHSPTLLNKIILCGVPMKDLDDISLENYKILHEIPDNKLIIFQNSNDPHGSFNEVAQFLSKFGNLRVVNKEASDHEYPYFIEFRRFLHF